ncbi:hypothetical protein [Campylobacter sp. MIT 97-5078]|uniref:hypothetical protein n=1 Tax=Campylobacter sp. MIT 97-5078 TaxID=1548153 RepID=UPI00051328E8|nr:hypothetical protein [Campylobacter sp. MIT 97-5078]KGI55110.1 hypothetical protein LR59_13280 [Campylobacter sp. MIT 97-5078]KGI56825.1 hypothetical protein LR59_04920 [Campylobacter sp. MIT 97-5078]TQR25603.1 hypothetical protein DMB91_07310 [Campylobacter sp. MIT 97-5078]
MRVDLNCGDLGYKDIDLNADEIECVSPQDMKTMFKNMSDENQKQTLTLLVGNDKDEIQAIRAILQKLDTQEAVNILIELRKEFLTIDEFHLKLEQLRREV